MTCVYALPIDTVEDLYVRWPGWPHLACGAALLSWSLAHTTAVACHHMHPQASGKRHNPHKNLCKQLYRGNDNKRLELLGKQQANMQCSDVYWVNKGNC